jgi:hypothetical protein
VTDRQTDKVNYIDFRFRLFGEPGIDGKTRVENCMGSRRRLFGGTGSNRQTESQVLTDKQTDRQTDMEFYTDFSLRLFRGTR